MLGDSFFGGGNLVQVSRATCNDKRVLSQKKSDATYSNIFTCSDTRSIDNIWVVSNIYLRYKGMWNQFKILHIVHIDATVAAKKVEVMMYD